MDPIKYILEKPALPGWIDRWQIILTEYDIQYTTQKSIKGSVWADQVAHQVVDDYQSMNFEFLDENIILVTDCKKSGLYDGPEQGSRRTMVLMELPMLWVTQLALWLFLLKVAIHLSLPDYASIVRTIWLSTRHAFWVWRLPLIWGSSIWMCLGIPL